MFSNFEEYGTAVVKELERLLPKTFQGVEVEFTKPLVDEELSLMTLVLPNGASYPYELDRPSTPHYHDTEHLETVASLALYYLYKESLYEHRVSDGVVVYLAGLLHDIEHSLGAEPDEVNIRNSLIRARKLIPSGSMYRGLVLTAIEATKFPRVRQPTNLIEKCLMDADLTAVTMQEESGRAIFDKLFVEINESKRLKQEPPLTRLQMLDQQIHFQNTIELYTNEAHVLYSRYSDNMITEMKCLL